MDVPLTALLARLKRVDLEAIVSDAVSAGHLSKQAILDRLPETHRVGVVERTVVTSVSEVVQSGEEDGVHALSVELLNEIFSLLPFKVRLAAATSVCKAWRCMLRDSWDDVVVGTWSLARLACWRFTLPFIKDDDVSHESCGRVMSKAGRLELSSSGLLRLLKLIPSFSHLDLSISVDAKGPTQSLTEVEAVLKLLPNLFSLALSGEQLQPSLIQAIGELPIASSLLELNLYKTWDSGQELQLQILKKLPKLERLTCEIDETVTLHAIACALGSARGAGAGENLLTHLDVKSATLYHASPLMTLVDLGNLFPELQVLCMPHVYPTGAVPGSVAPLLRLKKLLLVGLGGRGPRGGKLGPLLTSEVGTLLRAIFAATPALEDLCLVHTNNWPPEAVALGAVLPGLDGALSQLPSTVTSLALTRFIIEPDALDACTAPLSSIRLNSCGDHAVTVIKRARVSRGAHLTECMWVEVPESDFWQTKVAMARAVLAGAEVSDDQMELYSDEEYVDVSDDDQPGM
tara:strand:+ start:483 stop:2033 length:1551 start_codon:yes stop_codon:yes gene_type:complete